MAEISWTQEAQLWLAEVYKYIAQRNPKLAGKTVQGIYDKTQVLEQFPQIGYLYDRIPERHIRILLYGHYRIAYLIKSDGNIDILGVFHSAIEIDRYLSTS